MKNLNQSFPSGTVYRKSYNKFKGVDMTTDPAKVADYRSPMAVNMISDVGGSPEKRLGWRVMKRFGEKPVNGLFSATLYESTYYFAHVGTEMYVWGGRLNLSIDNAVKINSDMADSKSFFFEGYAPISTTPPSEYGNQPTQCVFVLDGKQYRLFTDIPRSYDLDRPYNGFSEIISDYHGLDTYTPKTSIRRSPDGTVSTPFESVNLCSYGRWNYFDGDGTSTVFKLDTDHLADGYIINVFDENMGSYLDQDITFHFDLAKGVVTLSEAPPVGENNVRVIFSKKPEIDLNLCTIASKFTVGAGDNRVVLSGHPKFPNYEWVSDYNNCVYFPDNNYNVIGMGSNAITGYASVSGAQVIFKESDGQSPTVFMRTYTTDSDNNTVFLIKQGCVGYGAIAKRCIDSLAGEPLFLSDSGVIGLSLSDITQNTALQNRSFHVDALLCKEPNLQNALGCVCKGFFYVFINGKVYVLDGIQEKVYRAESIGDHAYECFYWDSVPAYTVAVFDGSVWFGTADGRLCRFNDDMTSLDKFNDYTEEDFGGAKPVAASWSTPFDHDDYGGRVKTLLKRGSCVILKPYVKSGVSVTAIADGDEKFTVQKNSALTTLKQVDFSEFPFDTSDAPHILHLNKKLKNYRHLQFVLKNSGMSEGFGVHEITKYYTVKNYSR